MVGIVVVALAVGACTGGGVPAPTGSPSAEISPSPAIHFGQATFGIGPWPSCINPITDCTANPSVFTTVLQHVLPRAMEVSAEGTFVASPMLAQAPTLQNGGLTQSPFTVTFRISEGAVWDDGSPITSDDFAFTWRALVWSQESVWADQYRHITSIESPDPKTAILGFASPYAPWPELFGGSVGFVLKAPAFPGEARQARPDLSSAMEGSIPFSGGPFELTRWTAAEAVLERNAAYFGRRPMLDRVTFIASPDVMEELQQLFSGEIDAISPGFEVSEMLQEHPPATPGIAGEGGPGRTVESLWFNLRSPPLDDPTVRYALALAIDRQSLIDQIVRVANPDAAVLNCGLLAMPGLGPWCATQPFARFVYDPQAARRSLEDAGYDCSTTICTKGGGKLRIDYGFTTANEKLRFDYGLYGTSALQNRVGELIRKGARAAGIDLRLRFGGGNVFSSLLCPPPRFTVMGCDRTAPVDPSISALVSCSEIPTEANGFRGQNSMGWCNQTADRLTQEADRELDPEQRRMIMEELYDLEAADVIGLPLFVVPALSLWRDDKLGGPIGTYSSTVYGMFFNMNEWFLEGQ